MHFEENDTLEEFEGHATWKKQQQRTGVHLDDRCMMKLKKQKYNL